MEKITIEVPEGKKAEWVNGVLTLIDKVDNLPITERVKSYSDACKVLGIKERCFEGMEKDEIAYIKLKTIAQALNEDADFPRFSKDECLWFPVYNMYTQKDIVKMNEKQKSKLLMWNGYSPAETYCAIECERFRTVFSESQMSFGSALALKTKELTIYSGTQFIEIWKDFVICK